jgi:cytochrome P450
MSAYVMPLPLYVVCELLGLPLADAAQVRAWIEELSVFNDFTATPQRQLEAAHSSVAFENYLAVFLDGHTGDDLTTALLASGAFDTEQMISLLITLIFGGHETTANLIGNTLMQLVPPADDVRRWTHTSEEVAAAVEETLRHDPPVQGMYRRVVAETEVGGARIPAGAQVFALIGAANRDGEVFAEPDRWAPQRDAPKHLAFGQGVHYCLGAQLAKMEAKVAITTLVERLPDLSFVPGFTGDYLPNLMHRGPAQLPVRWRTPS